MFDPNFLNYCYFTRFVVYNYYLLLSNKIFFLYFFLDKKVPKIAHIIMDFKGVRECCAFQETIDIQHDCFIRLD
jgi:hypothetical protein